MGQVKFLLPISSFFQNFWSFSSISEVIQLNIHETNLIFQYLSHYLTWHCSSISEDLHRFARNLKHLLAKLFLFCSKTIVKSIFQANAANFLQICVNLHKYWNNIMFSSIAFEYPLGDFSSKSARFRIEAALIFFVIALD